MRLGPFICDQVIGRGGMGEVWAGHHVDGWPVAIKVLTARTARVETYQRAFESEVRAIAGLNHPAIVAVYDHGTVPGAAELPGGSSYLVMEQGVDTLHSVEGTLPWGELRQALLAILDALGHAHARRILHRDLKPSNVLRMADGSLRVVDFGLAHPMGTNIWDNAAPVGGTPAFMSPEQVKNNWRSWGPWTDLYSVGCLAWMLACRRPPFTGKTGDDVMRRHVEEPPGPLTPHVAVGRGFEAWLGCLLQKDPARRFACAADAADALVRDVSIEPLVPAAARAEKEGTEDATVLMGDTESRRSVSSSSERSAEAPVRPARLVRDWRQSLNKSRSAFPKGVGLGLYGVRSLPLVGRAVERDALWQLLCRVHDEKRPHAVVLRGASGVGKSRLAQWLCERASETGVATWLKAKHASVPQPEDGLFGMIRQHLAAHDLRPQDRRTHLAFWALQHGGTVNRAQLDRLSALAAPDLGSELGSLEERLAALSTFLERVTTARPLVLLLEDVQWSRESLELATTMIRRNRHSVLWVMTLRDERADVELEADLKAAPIQQLSLEPLDTPDHAALVRELLGLDAKLGAEVERRTAGNPLFAIQLVGDWVERGLLTTGPAGFVRSPGANAEIPQHLHEVWARRIENVTDGRSEWLDALGVAAALGPQVDWNELRAVTGLEEAAARELLSRLLDAQLASALDSGFELAHAMLRESLERSESERGVWHSHHRRIADVLASRGAPSWRVGLHRLAAEQHGQAATLLLEGAEQLLASSESRRAMGLLSAFERAAARGSIPSSDRRHTWAGLLKGHVLLDRDTEAAVIKLASVAEDAGAQGWPALEAEARRLRGMALSRSGRNDLAVNELERALQVGEPLQRWPQRSAAMRALGSAHLYAGDARAGRNIAEKALQVARDVQGHDDVVIALLTLAAIDNELGDTVTATAHCDAALEQLDRVEHRGAWLGALCHHTRADIARNCGDYQKARTSFEEAFELVSGTGAFLEAVLVGDLGVIALTEQRYDEAERMLVEALAEAERTGHQGSAAKLSACLMVVHAALSNWERFDAMADAVEALSQERIIALVDIPRAAQNAAELAEEGQPRRALRAWKLARDHFALLKRHDERSVADKAIERLEQLSR